MSMAPLRKDVWMLDSGTTYHMIQDADELLYPEPCTVPIALGDNSVVHATEKETREVIWKVNGYSTRVLLTNTLC